MGYVKQKHDHLHDTMKRIRITREQSKNLTRQRLLDAAQTVFLKKGFNATSVENVTEAAGYTRGAFYSNFCSKTELLFELLRREHEAMQTDLQGILHIASACGNGAERALRHFSRLRRDNRFALLWIEARLLAARDPQFQARHNAFQREKLEQLTDHIREFSVRAGTPLPLPAEALAIGLMGLRDGLHLFNMIDPESVPTGLAESVMAAFLGRAVFGRDATVNGCQADSDVLQSRVRPDRRNAI
ncbi:hypothetical protein R75461_05961 [Paraburkholderia nemoris]|nr:hypothetical protein R75461_05961 [Paraburkholderia nemoris]